MLKLDWATIAFQVVNFLVIAAALYYLVFRPLMRKANERAEEREQLREQLEADRQEAERLRDELDERLADAEERADEIIAEAQEQAEAERQQMLEEVDERVDRILEEAREDVREMRRQAVDDFHDELIGAMMDVSAEVIRQAAPPELHHALVEQLGERIWEMGREEMDRVRTFRRSLGERTPTAYVTTAKPLSSEQQGELARTLTALADRQIDLQIEVDASLGAGMRVRVTDIVVDNSIAGRLEELRSDAVESLKSWMTDVNGQEE
jgi:F-type H+-transporting ATPase subunit b